MEHLKFNSGELCLPSLMAKTQKPLALPKEKEKEKKSFAVSL